MKTKRCSHCKKPKPLAEFCRNSNGRGDGLQSWCKPCKAVAAKAYRQANSKKPPKVRQPSGWNLDLCRKQKLTEHDVRLILQLGDLSSKAVALKFEVSDSLIRQIRRGEKHRRLSQAATAEAA